MRYNQVASWRDGVPVAADDSVRVLAVQDKVKDGHEQDRDWLGEIDEAACARMPENLLGAANIRLDHASQVIPGEQVPAKRHRGRVVVDIDHTGAGSRLLSYLMRAACSWDA